MEDTGIGIEEDKHEKIFERFYQIDYSGNRKYEGLGLGLSITKAYADLAGNRLWLSSKPNKGTTFYFTVPYLQVQKEIVKQGNLLTEKKSTGKSIKTVLIAEDTDSNYRLLEIYLASEEFKIVRAKDGREAVDFCKTEEQIDLILMDIKMPDMDGFEATRIIRGILPNVPVIAHTAYATEADKKKIFSSGFAGYIAKPYSKADLLATVNKLLKQDMAGIGREISRLII